MDSLKKAFKNNISYNTPNNLQDIKRQLNFEQKKKPFWHIRIVQIMSLVLIANFLLIGALLTQDAIVKKQQIELYDNAAFGYSKVGAIPLNAPQLNEKFIKRIHLNGREYNHFNERFIDFFNGLELEKTTLSESEILENLIGNASAIAVEISYFKYTIYFTPYDRLIIRHQNYHYIYKLIDAEEIWSNFFISNTHI